MLIVEKFGGSSLADSERMRRAAQLISEPWRRGLQVLAVVSAAGDTTDELSFRARQYSPCPDSRELDALLSTGEQQSAACLAMLLRAMGAPALSLTGWQAGIITEGSHGSGTISEIIPDKIKSALGKGQIVIISGFQGVSSDGDIFTLGRGGSDTSAAALAAFLGAQECRIYTDVNGIYTADPRLIPSARLWQRIDYRDMLALSRCGSQVLKADSVSLAMENRLKLRLLSSFEASPGTELCFLDETQRPDFAGVTKDYKSSSVSAAGKAVSPGLLPLLINELESAGIAPESAGVGEGCLSIKVAREQLEDALKVLHGCLIK